MKRRISVTAIVAVFMLMTTVSAHALKYDSGNLSTLSAGESTVFSFLAAPGNFSKAIFSLNIDSLLNSNTTKFGATASSPPSGEFFVVSGTVPVYLFTTDFHLGKNVLNLHNFLSQLNSGNTSSGLSIGLLMDRGTIAYDGARLRGTVAPEPASMALLAAGLVALPFARRMRKGIAREV